MTSSAAPPESTRIDGRVARAERTRTAIADALHGLLIEGNPVSARVVAERAEVSLRSVFQHFEDMESVFAEVARRQESTIRPHLEPLDSSLPLVDRINGLVASRDELFATIAPVRRAVHSHRTAKTSPFIRTGLAQLHRAQRDQIIATFPHEVGHDEPLSLRIDVWLSFDTWDQFVTQHGLSRKETRGHLASVVGALLA
jgi:AcrR family transcriptional regulator